MVRKRTIVVALLLAPTPALCCCVAPVPQLVGRVVSPGLTAGQVFRHDQWVRGGMTRDEVRTVFGQPPQVTESPDGRGTWVYYEGSSPVIRTALVIDFDRAGGVSQVSIAD